MKRTLTIRKCMLALILGVSVFIMLAPSATAFFSTANLPPPGWRNAWPGAQGNTDVSASVIQIDDQQAIINLQAFTGGPIGNPQFIGPPPGGQDWVWVVEYDITAQFVNPSCGCIDQTEAAIRAELWLIRGGMNWKCTETVQVNANAQNPFVQNTGWLYLYEANAQYRQGDIYFLYVHAQGRYHTTPTPPCPFHPPGPPYWTTTAQQSVSLYYAI